MNARVDFPHSVSPGWEPACLHPEIDGRVSYEGTQDGCRGCLTAFVALGVNAPFEIVVHKGTGERTIAAKAALFRVRQHLDAADPLRMRAEQALLPFVGAA